MSLVPGLLNYWVVIILMMAGLWVVVAQDNLVKKLVGLGLFQTSVFIFYISLGKLADGAPPIIDPASPVGAYSNPLPHVLILTAIVVAVATTAVGLGLVVRIHQAYRSIEEDEIHRKDLLDETSAGSKGHPNPS